ncbi:ATP-binding protein [Pantoea sp. Mb-10]|uniref:ATP-binding protein n=1 Tax=unclassified Pantoea TaxID=2630326 RepID=UPI001E2BF894|nr:MULTISPECIES: ATP-binding protein [unclassified Pantoea]MCE0490894.1 ATP-binding protein [Pantoea sp. Mb-10]MCE0499948.1 ATP-binding protein [Pantoea sp. Pb-8]
MKREPILSRQVLTYMLSLTFTIVAVSVLGSFLFYTVIINYIPGGAEASTEDQMTFLDWVWVLISTTISVAISLFFTVKLSGRILTPLNSLAASLKKISQGDLAARAHYGQSHLGELKKLVDDFNAMAERLQTLDAQRNAWNAAIAHELRTPVTILRGRLQGLVDGVFTPEPMLFGTLLKQTEGLTNLIDDLRVVSASSRVGFSLSRSEVNLKEILESTLSAFSPEFTRHAFSLTITLQDQVCQCDPLRILQCLNVLFDNAVQYATSRALHVSNGVTQGQNWIVIEDEGPGVSDAGQKCLFQPFQRGTEAQIVNPGGYGLGLSVVKALMVAHGGDATYQRTHHNHSVFTLSWPV